MIVLIRWHERVHATPILAEPNDRTNANVSDGRSVGRSSSCERTRTQLLGVFARSRNAGLNREVAKSASKGGLSQSARDVLSGFRSQFRQNF